MESKEQTPFKIGSTYRAKNGNLYKLHLPIGGVHGAVALAVNIATGCNAAHRSLIDGRDLSTSAADIGCRDLLPGELNERGEPITEAPTFYVAEPLKPAKSPECPFVVGKTYRTRDGMESATFDGLKKGVAYFSNKHCLHARRADGRVFGDEIVCTDFLPEEVPQQKPALTAALDKLEKGYASQAAQREPKRPALTWADTKPFDAFKGFFTEREDHFEVFYPKDGTDHRLGSGWVGG